MGVHPQAILAHKIDMIKHRIEKLKEEGSEKTLKGN